MLCGRDLTGSMDNYIYLAARYIKGGGCVFAESVFPKRCKDILNKRS